MRTPFAYLVQASLVAVCCAAPASAYREAGVSDGNAVADNPGLDVTHHAMPAQIVAESTESAKQTAPPQQTTPDDSDNPLWAIPMSTMTATRDRPLFLPSRRPPAPVVANEPAIAPPPPPPPPPPERANLVLIGTVVSENKGIALFTDQSISKTILLRTGDQHNGWILQSVAHRVAILKKRDQSEILQLQKTTAVRSPVTALNMPQVLKFRHR
jgi:general secretion pathway protein N